MTPSQKARSLTDKYGKQTAYIVAKEMVNNRSIPVEYWEEVLEILKP